MDKHLDDKVKYDRTWEGGHMVKTPHVANATTPPLQKATESISVTTGIKPGTVLLLALIIGGVLYNR